MFVQWRTILITDWKASGILLDMNSRQYVENRQPLIGCLCIYADIHYLRRTSVTLLAKIKMIRSLFRMIGYLLLSVAFVALVLDGVAYLATGEVKFAIAGQSWTDIAPASLNQVQFALQEHLGLVWFWDNVMQRLLLQPTAAVIAGFGLFFCFLGKRRKKKENFAT